MLFNFRFASTKTKYFTHEVCTFKSRTRTNLLHRNLFLYTCIAHKYTCCTVDEYMYAIILTYMFCFSLLFILFRSNTSSTDPLVESSSLVDTTNTEHLTKANETIATTQSIIDLSQTQQDSTHHDSTDTVLPSNTNEQLVGTNNELIGDSVKESADSNEGAGSNQEDSAHNTSEPEDPQQGVDQSEGEMTHSIDTEEGTSIHSIHNTDSIDEVDGDGRGSVGVAQEEEGDDIVTFEEFKSKMNQEVVINKPPQG